MKAPRIGAVVYFVSFNGGGVYRATVVAVKNGMVSVSYRVRGFRDEPLIAHLTEGQARERLVAANPLTPIEQFIVSQAVL